MRGRADLLPAVSGQQSTGTLAGTPANDDAYALMALHIVAACDFDAGNAPRLIEWTLRVNIYRGTIPGCEPRKQVLLGPGSANVTRCWQRYSPAWNDSGMEYPNFRCPCFRINSRRAAIDSEPYQDYIPASQWQASPAHLSVCQVITLNLKEAQASLSTYATT